MRTVLVLKIQSDGFGDHEERIYATLLSPEDWTVCTESLYHDETGISLKDDMVSDEEVEKYHQWLLTKGFTPISWSSTNIRVDSIHTFKYN